MTDHDRFVKKYDPDVENRELLEDITVIDGEVHTTANAEDIIDRIDDPDLREHERDGYPLETSGGSALGTIPFNFYPPEAGSDEGGRPLLTVPLKSAEDVVGQQQDILADVMIVNELQAISSAHIFNTHKQAAYLKAANRFMNDNLSTDHDAVRTAVAVNPDHVDLAVEEIERYADDPNVVYIIAPADTERPIGNQRYDPLWEAVEAADIPFVMHGMATSRRNLGGALGMDTYHEHRTLAQVLPHARNAVSLIGEEVVERFDVDWAFIEHCLSWAPFLMGRFDREATIRGYEAPGLTDRPSDYMARDFHYGTMSLEPFRDPEFLGAMLEMMDMEDQVFYTSDYPHPDADHPGMVVDHEGLTETQKRKILEDNPRELFGIEA